MIALNVWKRKGVWHLVDGEGRTLAKGTFAEVFAAGQALIRKAGGK